MPQPVVSPLAQRMYDYLAPWHQSGGVTDEDLGWPLLRWCTGWAGILQDVYDVVKTRNGKEGWTALTDPDQAIELTMPFLAQLIGTRLTQGQAVEQWRETIKDAAGLYAGTPEAIAGVLSDLSFFNTTSPTIFIEERSESAYTHRISFLASEVDGVFRIHDTFENGAVGWEKDTAYLGMGVTAAEKKNGSYSMRMRNPLGHGELFKRVIPHDAVVGHRYRVSLWIKVDSVIDSPGLTVGLTGVGGTPTYVIQVDQTPSDGWVHYSQTFVYDADPGVDLEVWFSLITGIDQDVTWWVDDLKVESKEFPAETMLVEVKRIARPQKPLGHRFIYDLITEGEWTWEIAGSDVYRRNANGYMEKLPSLYATWEEVAEKFATWEDFAANNPIGD